MFTGKRATDVPFMVYRQKEKADGERQQFVSCVQRNVSTRTTRTVTVIAETNMIG